MILFTILIRKLLDLEFCGEEPCVKCPKYGVCNGNEVVCERGKEWIRYDCAENPSLPYFAQEMLLDAEVFLVERAFLTWKYEIGEMELLEELNANHIIFYKFIEAVKAGQSKVLTWRKDTKRWVEVKSGLIPILGPLILINKYFYPIFSLFLISSLLYFSFKKLYKVKND